MELGRARSRPPQAGNVPNEDVWQSPTTCPPDGGRTLFRMAPMNIALLTEGEPHLRLWRSTPAAIAFYKAQYEQTTSFESITTGSER